jgi:hypothetical protein
VGVGVDICVAVQFSDCLCLTGIFLVLVQLLEKPKLKAAVSTPSVVLPKQQTTKLIGELGGNFGTQSYGMLRHATRHFFSDGAKHFCLMFSPEYIFIALTEFDLGSQGESFGGAIEFHCL